MCPAVPWRRSGGGAGRGAGLQRGRGHHARRRQVGPVQVAQGTCRATHCRNPTRSMQHAARLYVSVSHDCTPPDPITAPGFAGLQACSELCATCAPYDNIPGSNFIHLSANAPTHIRPCPCSAGPRPSPPTRSGPTWPRSQRGPPPPPPQQLPPAVPARGAAPVGPAQPAPAATGCCRRAFGW